MKVVRSAAPKRTVANPTTMRGAHGLGLRVGWTLQIRRWTTQRTPTNDRAVNARANPPTTRATIRLASDKVLVLVTALASSPVMPAERAASPGS